MVMLMLKMWVICTFQSFFVENIRACRRLTVELGKNKKAVVDFLSVLAQPNLFGGGGAPGNQNRLGGYTYFNGITQTQDSIYTPLPGETPINIVDGSYGGVQPTGYVDFNCAQYTTWLNTWNEWIQGCSSYLTTLCSVGNEPGARALSTLIHTVSSTLINSNGRALKKDKSRKIVYNGYKGELFSKKDVQPDPSTLDSTYYQNVAITSYTSNVKPLASLWKYAKLMVMPVNPTIAGVTGGYTPFFSGRHDRAFQSTNPG